MDWSPAQQSVFDDGKAMVAIGDLHGNYAGFLKILQHAGLVDEHEHWIARDTHLVQLGDILGRGGEPGKIFRLLNRIEREALDCGSRVHILLGNHEAMSMRGQLLYNTFEEFRDLAHESLLEPPGAEVADLLPEGVKGRLGRQLQMLGSMAFRATLAPGGKVGNWLSHHSSALAINGCLFVHGGLNREHGFRPLDEINMQVRKELSAAPDEPGEASILPKDGPQWNREFTLRASPEKGEELKEVLDFHGCSHMVVGHTPTKCIDSARAGQILPLYEGRLYCIDTGIGKSYGGNLSALRIAGGAFTAIYP